MEAGKINDIMQKIDSFPYQKVLFDGAWGIGKTKHVLEAIEGKENIYYISLFGKKDINTFYEELYYLLLNKNQIKVKKILRHFNKINISKFGMNISIPLVSDLLTSIQKQLKNKDKIVIIIDDLERKSEKLEIKEVFGFIDSVTRNEKIKIVLVASSNNFSDDEKIAFHDYAEKSIDRIYKITTYSKEAPINILGENIWSSVNQLYREIELKNLRTLEKIELFIKEVVKEIPETIFNHKFNREDLYKICAAVVIFVTEHNKNLKLLPEVEEKDTVTASIYESYKAEENFPNYILNYILKRNLENNKMLIFIGFILEWYETGSFSKERLNNLIKQIDSHKEVKTPLFMSDSQIEAEISVFSNFVNNLDTDISIKDIIQRLDQLANIAEKTNLECNYNVDEVVQWLLKHSKFKVNYNSVNLDLLSSKESNLIKEVITNLKMESRNNYGTQLVTKMVSNLEKDSFTDDDIHLINDLKSFYNELRYLKKDEETEKLIDAIRNNEWFLPLPIGEITHSHWRYCHSVLSFISNISIEEKNSIKNDAREYFKEEIRKSSDKIFKYRMNSLIGQYLE